ncbi:hypothetical protein [Kutzneria sp. CA-103260]|uniref:hypothetical protein n=1 Tax=Kutzneria sp. CA-103260 TaxID=2802641 RepID=UPI001BACB995|nr:hypothetical protein [Kutzneria sp. CA-103260]QUQ64239.1 hypothetical protein JJ691_19590 [Kutzneria sp. CA-103260]
MSEFVAVLRGRVRDAQQALRAAWEAGYPYEAGLHSGRLADLVELAGQHGIDIDGWVAPDVLAQLGEEDR